MSWLMDYSGQYVGQFSQMSQSAADYYMLADRLLPPDSTS
jgi:hypothetical protein